MNHCGRAQSRSLICPSFINSQTQPPIHLTIHPSTVYPRIHPSIPLPTHPSNENSLNVYSCQALDGPWETLMRSCGDSSQLGMWREECYSVQGYPQNKGYTLCFESVKEGAMDSIWQFDWVQDS